MSECKGIILLPGTLFPSPSFTLMEMAPSLRLASDKSPNGKESRAELLIRQLQSDLVLTLGEPCADKVGLGPAAHQLLSQTCLRGPTPRIGAMRYRELLFFLTHQSGFLVATSNRTWEQRFDKDG